MANDNYWKKIGTITGVPFQLFGEGKGYARQEPKAVVEVIAIYQCLDCRTLAISNEEPCLFCQFRSQVRYGETS